MHTRDIAESKPQKMVIFVHTWLCNDLDLWPFDSKPNQFILVPWCTTEASLEGVKIVMAQELYIIIGICALNCWLGNRTFMDHLLTQAHLRNGRMCVCAWYEISQEMKTINWTVQLPAVINFRLFVTYVTIHHECFDAVCWMTERASSM